MGAWSASALINSPYLTPCSLVAALILVIQSARQSRFLLRRSRYWYCHAFSTRLRAILTHDLARPRMPLAALKILSRIAIARAPSSDARRPLPTATPSRAPASHTWPFITNKNTSVIHFIVRTISPVIRHIHTSRAPPRATPRASRVDPPLKDARDGCVERERERTRSTRDARRRTRASSRRVFSSRRASETRARAMSFDERDD